MKNKQHLSIKELVESDLLPGKNTEASIRAMVARRQIPYRKLSGRVYFLRDEVVEWLRTREGNPIGKRRRMNPEIMSLAETIGNFDSESIQELKAAIESLTFSIDLQSI